MQIYLFLSALVNTLTSTILGIIVYRKNKSSSVNKTFAYFCLSVSVWSYAYLFFPLSGNKSTVLLSFQALHIGACFVSVTYFHFVSAWLDLNKKYKKSVIIGYFFAIFFVSQVFSPLFIADMVPKFSMPLWANPGPLYHFYLIFFYFYALFASYLLVKNYKNTEGIKRAQTKYILIGMAVTYLGGSMNYPLWYNINIPPYGNILASAFVVCSAYAIIKYRLMDIRIMLRKSTVNVASVLALLAVVIPLNLAIMMNFTDKKLIASAAITALMSAVLYPQFKDYFHKLANKYFFSSLYDERDLLSKISRELRDTLDEAEVYGKMADIIGGAFHASGIAVIIKDSKSRFVVEYSKDADLAFNKVVENDKNVIDFFNEKPDIFVFDEKQKSHPDKFRRTLERMEKHKLRLLVPLKTKNNLIGMIALGEKCAKDVYSKEDLQILEIIANQSATVVENARLYSELHNFNEILKKKVDEQTKDLQEKNVNLEKLLEMRTEFLDTASHQLRTPISIIRGQTSMLAEGMYDKISNQEKMEIYADILEGANRMNHIIDDILQASECDTNKSFSLEGILRDVSILDCADKVLGEFSPRIEKKKIKLEFKHPKNIPLIKSSESHLRHIIKNILDNAVIFTPENGEIKIKISKDKKSDKIRLEIKDSGIGIPKKDLPDIFDKFTRGGNAISMYANGSGLGLFIAKRLTEAHPGGQIGIESEEGKGTLVWAEFGKLDF